MGAVQFLSLVIAVVAIAYMHYTPSHPMDYTYFKYFHETHANTPQQQQMRKRPRPETGHDPDGGHPYTYPGEHGGNPWDSQHGEHYPDSWHGLNPYGPVTPAYDIWPLGTFVKPNVQAPGNGVVSSTGGMCGHNKDFWKQTGYKLKLLEITQNGVATDRSAVAPYGGTIQNILQIAQGTNSNSRVGNRLVVDRICLNYALNVGSQTVVYMRLLVIYDRQPNGASPLWSDVLSTNNGGIPVRPQCGYNYDNSQRFLILYDRYVTGGGMVVDCYNADKLNLPVTFKGTSSAITDISTGSIHFMVLASTTANSPTLDFFSSIKYKDC